MRFLVFLLLLFFIHSPCYAFVYQGGVQAAGSLGTDSVGTDELDDGSETPTVNKLVKVNSSDTSRFSYGDCGESSSAIDCPAHPTDGGEYTLKEGQDDGTNFYRKSLPDSGITTTIDYDLEDDASPDDPFVSDLHPITIESPVDADNFFLFRAHRAMTVIGIDCIVEDATSAVITVQECDSNGNTCTAIEAAMTCAVTNTAHSGAIDNASLDSGDYIRVDVGTVTGTVGQVHVTVEVR